MKKSDLQKLTQKIMDNIGNQAIISETLTEIINANDQTEGELVSLTETNKTLTEDNSSLLKVNNKLFTQLGSQYNDDTNKDEEQEEEQENEEEELPSIDDIVKEF